MGVHEGQNARLRYVQESVLRHQTERSEPEISDKNRSVDRSGGRADRQRRRHRRRNPNDDGDDHFDDDNVHGLGLGKFHFRGDHHHDDRVDRRVHVARRLRHPVRLRFLRVLRTSQDFEGLETHHGENGRETGRGFGIFHWGGGRHKSYQDYWGANTYICALTTK